MILVDHMDTALQAAWEAGDILLSRLSGPRELQVKGVREVVTDADFAAQRVIVEALQRTYPDHRIVAEEGAGQLDLASAAPIWLVDPLDGTTNYSRGFPAFSVSISLAQNGIPVLGVVHDPLTGRTFIGEQGLGSHVLSENAAGEMKEIRASSRIGLEEAIIGLEWPHDNPTRAVAVELLGRVAPKCRTFRAIGSAALALAYVGAGWLDGYYSFALHPWDVAAGVAIAQAAGAQAVGPDGAPWSLRDTRLVAGSSGVVTEILELIDS